MNVSFALALAGQKRAGERVLAAPSGLVNELYLELLKIKALPASERDMDAERQAFLGLAAQLMRRLLIHHARPLSKPSEKSTLEDLPDARVSAVEALAEIEEALQCLAS